MEYQAAHLGLRDHGPGRVLLFVRLGFDAQALCRSGTTGEIDERLEGPQRLTAPVLRDVAEKPVPG